MTRKLAMAAAALLLAGGAARADGIDPIKVRQAGMDLVGGTVNGIKAVVTANGDVKPLANAAKGIGRWSAVIPTLFPAGSDKDTKAAPAIWSDPAGFQKAAMALGTAAASLESAATAGDSAAVATAFKAVGDACGACHKDYRLK